MTPLVPESAFLSLSVVEVLVSLCVALLCSLVIAGTYRLTYSGISYSASFVPALVMLTIITALVIMVIENNLARAFGLVGAMSIIRFRTAVKDTQDIVFIFFSLAVGLAAGAGMYAVSATGTLFVSAVIGMVSLLGRARPWNPEYLVQLVVASDTTPDPSTDDIFRRYCEKYRLVNIKRIAEDDMHLAEYSYYVVLKSPESATPLTRALQDLDRVMKVNVFFDEA